MERKDFAPKKELKDGKRLDTGRKRMNEKASIQKTMKGFHSIIKVRLCVFLHPL